MLLNYNSEMNKISQFFKGSICQQYVVDCYASFEQYRLCGNQSKVRAGLYKGLSDVFTAGVIDALVVSQIFVFPLSFTKGSRNMIQH